MFNCPEVVPQRGQAYPLGEVDVPQSSSADIPQVATPDESEREVAQAPQSSSADIPTGRTLHVVPDEKEFGEVNVPQSSSADIPHAPGVKYVKLNTTSKHEQAATDKREREKAKAHQSLSVDVQTSRMDHELKEDSKPEVSLKVNPKVKPDVKPEVNPEVGPEVGLQGGEEKLPLTKLNTMSKGGAFDTPSTALNARAALCGSMPETCTDVSSGSAFGCAMNVISWMFMLYHALLRGYRLLALLRGHYARTPQKWCVDTHADNVPSAKRRTRKHKMRPLTGLDDIEVCLEAERELARFFCLLPKLWGILLRHLKANVVTKILPRRGGTLNTPGAVTTTSKAHSRR